jgi:hypothetical protein
MNSWVIGSLRVHVATTVATALHWHPAEEGTEEIVKLLVFVILLGVLLPVLSLRSFLLRAEAIIMRPLLHIDQNRIGI